MFFLTESAVPYELRWEVIGDGPFDLLMVHLELSVLGRAWTEQRGAVGAPRNVSRGQDAQLSALLGVVRAELRSPGPPAVCAWGG